MAGTNAGAKRLRRVGEDGDWTNEVRRVSVAKQHDGNRGSGSISGVPGTPTQEPRKGFDKERLSEIDVTADSPWRLSNPAEAGFTLFGPLSPGSPPLRTTRGLGIQPLPWL